MKNLFCTLRRAMDIKTSKRCRNALFGLIVYLNFKSVHIFKTGWQCKLIFMQIEMVRIVAIAMKKKTGKKSILAYFYDIMFNVQLKRQSGHN